MSERDDSMLNTGLTSASIRARDARREEARSAKERAKRVLSPSEEMIEGFIDEQLALVRNVETIVLSTDSTEETYKALILARRMNIEFIKSFRAQLRNALRERPEKKKRPSDE